MRRDIVFVLIIAAAAFGIRTYPVWDSVFTPSGVSFLETDAWYHLRLIENQVRNYPWRTTVDPYAAPGGQFVPIAPLLDTLTATVVVLSHGRDADTDSVERIAAFVPPILGTLAIVAIWALARRLFDRRAGLLAAALLTVWPGHFMDRTMLGFVDHHALEVLMALSTMLALVRGCDAPSLRAGVLAGLALGLYLLAWGSGAFLLAILGVWLLAFAPLARSSDALRAVAATTGVAALIAFVLVVLFQDARMHRFGSQIIGLTGLAALALAITMVARESLSLPRKRVLLAAFAIVALMAGGTVAWLNSGLISQLVIDLARLMPSTGRMNVLEARPLFLYSGEWKWGQPWIFFRTGFYVGVLALIPFAWRVWRERRPGDVMVWIFAVACLVATIGQNRFGYYLMPAFAILGGWLAVRLLDWGGVPHADNPHPVVRTRVPYARELAIVAIAGGMFASTIGPLVLLADRRGTFPVYWRDAMMWLRSNTPPPFASAGLGEAFYDARYLRAPLPSPDYTIMNWWDQGYWIAQRARRIAVSNPTQERAPNAARFYSEPDETRALEMLRGERSRYVLADWELPFRRLADGAIMGRFQSVVDWAARPHAPFYEILYRREDEAWIPLWVFYEDYYRSMAFRLAVLGGLAGTPSNSTTVMTVADRVDASGLRFREAVTLATFPTYDAALQAAAAQKNVEVRIAGLNPWTTAFPVPALDSLKEVHAARAPGQRPTESPMVRIFEVAR